MLLCPDFDLDETCWIEAPYPEIKWKGTTQLNTAQVTVAMVRDPLAQLQSWRKAAELATNIKLEECGNDLDRFTCPRSILLKHDVMAEYHGWRLCVMYDGNQVVRGTKEDNDSTLQLQEFAQRFSACIFCVGKFPKTPCFFNRCLHGEGSRCPNKNKLTSYHCGSEEVVLKLETQILKPLFV